MFSWQRESLDGRRYAAHMLIRSGLLLVSASANSRTDDAVLAEVQSFLGTGLEGFLPLTSYVYAAPSRYQLEETLRAWCDEEEFDLIVTIGGTFPAPGPSNQEIVPEATAAVLERFMPSLPETMRAWAAQAHPLARLDRGVAGIRGRTLILNLPPGRELALGFLESILDLIGPIVSCLGTEGATVGNETAPVLSSQEKTQPRSAGLDNEEFAAFLRRQS